MAALLGLICFVCAIASIGICAVGVEGGGAAGDIWQYFAAAAICAAFAGIMWAAVGVVISWFRGEKEGGDDG